MTVRCLTPTQKQDVTYLYFDENYQVSDIARIFGVSTRTINRVIDEDRYAQPIFQPQPTVLQKWHGFFKSLFKPNNVQASN